MAIITDPKGGLFPHPKEIKLSCSCPDWADMCKHVAAVLYGVGARLDTKPEELFALRQADHLELLVTAGTAALTKSAEPENNALESSDLSSLFGIDIAETKTKETKTKTAKMSTDKPKVRAKSAAKANPVAKAK